MLHTKIILLLFKQSVKIVRERNEIAFSSRKLSWYYDTIRHNQHIIVTNENMQHDAQ